MNNNNKEKNNQKNIHLQYFFIILPLKCKHPFHKDKLEILLDDDL